MPVYHYQAINQNGRSITGSMPAPNESSLEEKLREAGLWLTDARVQLQRSTAKGMDQARVRQVKLKGGRGRRELIEFCTIMTFQIKAGVTAVRALDVAAQDCKSPAFRSVLLDMQRQIESGMTINETLALYPGVFSLHFISVIRAGEISSRLPEAFEDLRAYLEWMEQIATQIRQASIYPAIVMFVILCFAIFLFTFIVPKFAALLTSLKVPLPFLTAVIFGLGDFASSFWWVWPIVLVLLGVGIPVARRTSPAFALQWDRWKLSYPIFGELNLMLALSRFTHNFSILYRSGLPILQAFRACQQGLIGNKVVEQAVAAVEEEVKAGSTITEAMHRQPVFPGLLVRMISVGESSGNLDHALDNVSDYYNQVIPRRVKAVFAVAEPLLMLLLIFIVGCVALAIYMPILSLMDAVGKQ
jgi:type IV pilus assembly protein PilC